MPGDMVNLRPINSSTHLGSAQGQPEPQPEVQGFKLKFLNM